MGGNKKQKQYCDEREVDARVEWNRVLQLCGGSDLKQKVV